VSPLIHWDLKLAFGQLISANNPETDSLVSLDSIFQLTRLSWFNEATMPDEARRPLLDWLEKTHPSLLQQVRAKWAEILTINKPPTDSIAFDDYSLALTINALNQKPTPRQKQKLNEELERSLVNEPRQDFLVLDYLAAQRTPLDAFVPKRFKDYLRDPERRIPTLRAWIWQVPLWLLGGFLLFSFNYSPNCTEGVAMTKTRMACIKNDQDILTLNEYAICDVLDKNYWRLADVKADSVIAWRYFAPSANVSNNFTQRVDDYLLANAQKLINEKNLNPTSFLHNVKVAYANAAIRHINRNNRDSACLYFKYYSNLQGEASIKTDTILTIEEELYFFQQVCTKQKQAAVDNSSFAIQNRAPRIVTKLPSQNNKAPIPQSQTQQNATRVAPPVVQQNNNPYKDTTQQQKAKIADILSISISGLQKDIATFGESLNINYAISNDGKDVINNMTLGFYLNGTDLGKTKIAALSIGETKRGVQNITIPKDIKVGRQTLIIKTEWQGQTLNSNSQAIEITPTKGTTKY
jgi:CARDB